MIEARAGLVGRVALVTGAAGGGIGTAIARTLATSGARVVAHARTQVAAQQLVDELSSQVNCELAAAHCDLRERKAVERMVESVSHSVGPPSILVCNAASGHPAAQVDRLHDEVWDDDLATILTGSFAPARACAPHMITKGWGRIVFISSSAAWRGTWGRPCSYAAAKAGLMGLTRSLALELGRYGITVNCVLPSQIDTPRIRAGGRKDNASLCAYSEQSVPLGRVGLPQDVADLVWFLCSDLASYITGQLHVIDGGSSLASRTTREVSP